MSNPETSLTRRKFFDLAASAAGVVATSRARRRAGTARRQRQGSRRPDRLGQPRAIGGRTVRQESSPDVQYVANCDAYATRLDQGNRAAVRPAEGREARGLRGLPPNSRSQGRRCRPHRHAGPLALPDADRRHGRRQGRLSREAALEHRRARRRSAHAPTRASNRVVQFGTQQRSGSHFQEAAEDRAGRPARKDHACGDPVPRQRLWHGTGTGGAGARRD